MEMIADGIELDEYFANHQDDRSKVKPASAFAELVVDRFHGENTSASWTSTGFDKMAGKFDLRPGELTLWTGINGHGKTTGLSHVMLNAMTRRQKVCLASLEMPPAASMAKMTRQAGAVEVPAERYIRDFHTWTDGKLWVYDHVGKVAAARMLALATYVRNELGIDHLVIDNLMKCGLGTDDYTAQKDFVDSLCTIGRDTGLSIHLVVHMRKGETEHKAPDKFDVKGAGEIADLADNIVIIWKDQRREDTIRRHEAKGDKVSADDVRSTPGCFMRIAKQRHFEYEGSFAFWFDKASQQYLEAPFARPQWVDLGVVEESLESPPSFFDDVEEFDHV